LINLGEILLASDSLSRVLSQYDRLVKQDNYSKDGLLEYIELKLKIFSLFLFRYCSLFIR